jgi:hypothetical protein
MLRKFSHITLSTLLLVSTMGMVVSKHFCGDSFVSTAVFHQAKSCCEDSDCCHNEDSFYQVEHDFSSPVVLTTPVLAELDIFGHDLIEAGLLLSTDIENTTPSYIDLPPPPTIQKVLSLKQVYRL